MGVRIVLDGPRPAPGRLGRALAVAASLPLILVGVLGLIMLAYLLTFEVTGSVDAADRTSAVLYTAGCAVAAVLGLWLGLRLLRGHRRVVLFLRRFGYVDATRAVSAAATTALGGVWRLVTFDDDMARGIGGSTTPRRASGATLVLLVVAIAALVWWFAGIGGQQLFEHFAATGRVTHSSGDQYLDQIGGTLGAGLGVAMVVMFGGVLLLALLGVSVPLLLISYVRARRSERALTDRIRSGPEITGRVSAIARRAGKVLAPRLIVVTVAHAVWRQAVLAFAHSAGAVIIDVTVPSDSLRWEVTTLLPVLGHRCVLVGRLDALTRTLPDGRVVLSSPLARDVDGLEILAYRTDPHGLRRFARALRDTIDTRVG
jgi:hypothetical protein